MTAVSPLLQNVIDGDGNETGFPVPPTTLTVIPITGSSFPETLQAATAGQLTRLYRLFVVASANAVVTFLDGSSPLAPALTLEAGVPLELSSDLFPWYMGSINTDFDINIVAAGGTTLTGAAYLMLSPY
jgi:hypothetical protein